MSDMNRHFRSPFIRKFKSFTVGHSSVQSSPACYVSRFRARVSQRVWELFAFRLSTDAQLSRERVFVVIHRFRVRIEALLSQHARRDVTSIGHRSRVKDVLLLGQSPRDSFSFRSPTRSDEKISNYIEQLN